MRATLRSSRNLPGVMGWLAEHPWAEASAAAGYVVAVAQVQAHLAVRLFGWGADPSAVDSLLLCVIGFLYVRLRRQWHGLARRHTLGVAAVVGMAMAGFVVAHVVSLIMADVQSQAGSVSAAALVVSLSTPAVLAFGVGFGGVQLLVRLRCTIGWTGNLDGGRSTRWQNQR